MIPHIELPEAHLGYYGVYGHTAYCARHDFEYHPARCKCHCDVCPKCLEERLELSILLDALDEILDRLEGIDQATLKAGALFKFKMEDTYMRAQGGSP